MIAQLLGQLKVRAVATYSQLQKPVTNFDTSAVCLKINLPFALTRVFRRNRSVIRLGKLNTQNMHHVGFARYRRVEWKDKVTVAWRNLHNKELYNVDSLRDFASSIVNGKLIDHLNDCHSLLLNF
jgi:hypothetical protein